jgi:hypothetical protein
MRAWAWLVIGAVGGGCAAPDTTVPDYSPSGPGLENLASCDRLRELDAAVNGAARFVVDGGVAGCTPDGIECSLGVCEGGISGAKCFSGQWSQTCVPVTGGGLKDVAEAGEASEEG